VEGKRHVLQQMVPHLSAISDPISRSLYIEHVAQRLGVRSEQIVPLLKSVKERKNDSAGHPGPQGPAYDATEHLLMKLVFQHPEILPYVESTGVLDDLQEPEMVRLMPWIQKCVEIEGVLNPDIIIQMVENERLQELVAQLAYFEKEGIINERKTVEDCILKIRRRNIQRELEKNRVFIQEAQERGDKEKVDALLLEQQDLIKRRKQLHALRQNLI